MNLAIEKSIEPTERGPVCSVCCKPHDKDNPVGYFYPPANALDSWEQAASCDDQDAVPLYAAPVRTKDLTEKWIDPNDKSQNQYLPHIGEKVLFCCDGEVYYGHHTGGAFQKGFGVTKILFPTWDCMWMRLPAAYKEKNR